MTTRSLISLLAADRRPPVCGIACPYCGEYVTHSTSVLAGKPLWFIVLAILGIIAVIATILHWVRFLPGFG